MLDEAMTALRGELKALAVETEGRDVFRGQRGHLLLSLAPGLIVWVGLRQGFQWIGPDGRWRTHPLDDPAEVARLIAPLYRKRASFLGDVRPGAPV
ncbi:hypothetical protein [Planobispora rosea]|uniref:hypothetical protein n=1 Tax=Planobispora rosea TaxID=35762 RepID=UPI00083B82D6|nr:hypothetical protein [Planobispora rosea]